MATIEFSTPASAGGRFLHALSGAATRIFRLVRAYNNRRAVNRLLYLDTHMLRDIGITPGDVRSALSGPITGDPSQQLQQLAAERKAARRRTGTGNSWQ